MFEIPASHGCADVNVVLCIVMPYRLGGAYQRFGGKYRLHLPVLIKISRIIYSTASLQMLSTRDTRS
jgi:hypothetical protein